jgi:hypothetical protein
MTSVPRAQSPAMRRLGDGLLPIELGWRAALSEYIRRLRILISVASLTSLLGISIAVPGTGWGWLSLLVLMIALVVLILGIHNVLDLASSLYRIQIFRAKRMRSRLEVGLIHTVVSLASLGSRLRRDTEIVERLKARAEAEKLRYEAELRTSNERLESIGDDRTELITRDE